MYVFKLSRFRDIRKYLDATTFPWRNWPKCLDAVAYEDARQAMKIRLNMTEGSQLFLDLLVKWLI